MKECVVILGMHRSGTSVLSGLVSLQGYYVGADAMLAMKDNPKGFFENMKVYQLNQDILHAYGASWDDYVFTTEQIKPNDLHQYEVAAKKIILEEFGPVKRIFIKDPRMCLLFPLWEKVLNDLKYNIKVIIGYRSPMEVAHSLKTRNKMPYEKSLLLWSHHFLQAEFVSRKYKRLSVQYNDDYHDLNGFFNKLARFLDTNISEEMTINARELYSPKLKHHNIQIENISDDVPAYLRDLLEILGKDRSFDADRLDKIRDEFYNSQRLYLYNEVNLTEKNKSLESDLMLSKTKVDQLSIQIDKQSVEIEQQKTQIDKHCVEIGEQKLLIDKLSVEIEKQKVQIHSYDKNYKDLKKLNVSYEKDQQVQSNKLRKLKNVQTIGSELIQEIYSNRKLRNNFGRIIKGNYYYKNIFTLLPLTNKKNRNLKKDSISIIKSGLFSTYYYLTHNPDVWVARVDPLDHFCRYGWKEGRNPSKDFDCSAYLETNPDVAKKGINPLLHYIKFGKAEGRYPQLDVSPLKKTSKAKKNKTKKRLVSDINCEALRETLNGCVLPELLPSTDDILVSIIVLNRNGSEYLKTLIPAIYEHTKDITYELIVVDNASRDSSVSYLENNNYDINLTIIKNKNNETFSKGNNIGAEKASGEYLVLLNNDVEPLRGWLHQLLHVVETNRNVGSVGSRLVYPFKESFSNSCTIQHAGIAFRDEIGFFRPYNVGNGVSINSPSVQKSTVKTAITAACILVSKKIYHQVDGLDEGYDYGYEDVDFGLKLTNAGYQNHYCAESVLFHYEFGTQQTNNREEVMQRRIKNASLFQQKWFFNIKKKFWEEKLLNHTPLFSENPLTVAIAVTDYGSNVSAGDFFTAQELATELEKLGWTVVYRSRLKDEWYQLDDSVNVLITLLDSYNLKKLPKRNTRLYTIAWARNWFDKWCENPGFNDYDKVFASSDIACHYICNNSQQIASLLPIASSISRFSSKPKCEQPDDYKSDICFTGSYWDYPRDIMKALSTEALNKYRFHVYGANWEKFNKFKANYKGFIAYEDIACVYHNTRIVIDDANHVTKPYGSVNSRVFDALMAGALVITNGVEGSKELFAGELPYYESSQELDELLDFYLENEEARLDKILQLKDIILKYHTYKHRAESIRDILIQRFMSTSIAIKIPAPNWNEVSSWGDYHIAVLLKQQLENEGYYVLLQILPEWDNDEGMECDVAIVLRGLSRYTIKAHQVNLMWNISHPDKVTLQEYEEYNKVFIASDSWSKKIAKEVSVPVETMLQCTDPERFREPNDEEKNKNKQQLLFIGNSRKIYRKVLKDLLPTNYDLAVYGNNWQKIIPKKYIKGAHIDNDELYRHYGSADILLNDHWDDMREKGFVSNRIFDGLACGAFILTDKVQAMGDLQEFVQVYETKEDLTEKIEYYLNHPNERLKKAKNGIDFIKKNHTFKQRSLVFSRTIDSLIKV